jgi:hypothetical protein
MNEASKIKKAKNKKQALILLAGIFVVMQILIVATTLANADYKNLFYFELFFAGMVGLVFLDVYINKNGRRRKINHILRKLGLMPKPTEASMFVMALTALGLLLTSGEVWSEMSYVLSHDERGKSGLVFLYIGVGIFLSIYHAFSKREKKPWEIQMLKWFTVVTLVAVTISTAVYIYHAKQPAYLVFAIWNSIQAFALMFLTGKQYVGQYVKLPTRNATYLEVTLGIVVVISVLYLEGLFNTHWSIAFSSVLVVWSIIESYFQYDQEKTMIQNVTPSKEVAT